MTAPIYSRPPDTSRAGSAPIGFDPKLANWPTRTLPVHHVIDLLMVTHAPERVEEYRLAMLRGECLPPISVVRLFGRFFVADGHKRLTAYKALGAGEILVEVWPIRRWMSDQRRQVRNNLHRQIPALARALAGRGESERGRQVMRHFVDHWKRIFLSTIARFRGKSR